MMRLFVAFAISVTLFAGEALADQCAWTGKAIADAGAAVIKTAGSTVSFCEPCDEKAPGPVVKNRSVEVKQVDAKFWQVWVNGKGQDLAYVFIPTLEGPLKNVGLLVKCGAEDVSAQIPATPAPKKVE